MIKTFKRVERTGRLTAERIICSEESERPL